VVWLVRQACHSLYEAHERGLVHRDIKPGNLFLCRIGMDVDVLKVLDFGLVLPPREHRKGLSAEVETMPVGTPMYMAPEAVMAGPDVPINHSVDLYALGCAAYWLLSGRNVFERSDAGALMMAHLKQVPIPVSEVAPQPVPAGLESIVMACLAKDPADRPQTARELSDRLEALDLEREWTPERRVAWWALHESRKTTAGPSG
jgi:serine/threonine-protein kinase